MPNYDFSCTSCGKVRETYVPLSDFREKLMDYCPECKRLTFQEMVFSAPAIEDWGQGRYFEHLGPKGKTFYDKSSYKRHLRDNGLIEWSPRPGMPGNGKG